MVTHFPWMADTTSFHMDRLHARNHRDCAARLRLNAHGSRFEGVNSEVAEQLNAAMDPLKAALSRMTYVHFVAYVTLWVALHNSRILAENHGRPWIIPGGVRR